MLPYLFRGAGSGRNVVNEEVDVDLPSTSAGFSSTLKQRSVSVCQNEHRAGLGYHSLGASKSGILNSIRYKKGHDIYCN